MRASPKSSSRTETRSLDGKQDVRRLHVAVQDPGRVRVGKPFADLRARLDRRGVVQVAGAQRLAERLARDVLVGDVDVPRVAREGVGAQAARVAEAGGGGGLALGPRGGLALAGHDLEGDLEPGLLVAGEPDRPRSTAPERAQRAVSVEDEPGAFERERCIGHGSELVGGRRGVSSLTEARDTVWPHPQVNPLTA